MVWPWLQRLGEGLVDLVFPPNCVACHGPAPEYLCASCIASIRRVERPLCHCCGRPLDLLSVSPESSFRERALCARCRALPVEFDRCRAYGWYEGALREAILALKYHGKTAVIPALAELLRRALDEDPVLSRARTLVPVPLHPRRRRERGFNQAELLARALAAQSGRALRCDLIVKTRYTRPQVGLNAEQRRENLRDAFAVQGEAAPAGPILLIDDVTTTGATFHACACALRAAGATTIYALALARD
ncbi:MAG TPA: ComF family protein [Armatimonadota bacterium]|nr:ComF family protein [Armatimonadota bacterium]HOJ20580.1 ComF family protein [Armatimonadota bacterium]HOM83454.1 ComF family protein [Armatimonadota bacterium]HOQ28241.1 ComF family protein [Armatimonadota bacterium]HPO71211.1 ComF family protein [Armatimonadota bacterium]